jgi:predicted MPP superfamily phosphohydrolase
MAKFLRVLVAFTCIIHIPFVLASMELLRGKGAREAVQYGVTAVAAAWGIGLFVGRARKGMYDTRHSRLFVWLVDVPYFVHWSACLFTVAPSVVAAVWFLARGKAEMGFFPWVYGIGVVISAYGVVLRRRVFEVQQVEIAVPGLARGFDGYRIAQLSDLHIGTMTPESWGMRWVRAANEAKCDLAVVTGDLATSGTEFYDDIARVVGSLEARDGTFVSMGNHDYFGDGEPLIRRLREKGASVLRNEGRTIERGADRMYLAAIDDTWTKKDDMTRALAERPADVACVLLAHDPEKFREAARKGVEVVLSGHTHGGQIAVPFFARYVSLSKIAHHYTLGLYQKGRSTLFVHPGLGTTGPPIRIGVAPAVVVITLRAA